MSGARYFSQTVPGVAARRFCVLDPRRPGVVIRTQMSRPDGLEVPMPARVKFELPPTLSDVRTRAAAVNYGQAPHVSHISSKNCASCQVRKPLAAFRSASGARILDTCDTCRGRMRAHRQARAGAAA